MSLQIVQGKTTIDFDEVLRSESYKLATGQSQRRQPQSNEAEAHSPSTSLAASTSTKETTFDGGSQSRVTPQVKETYVAHAPAAPKAAKKPDTEDLTAEIELDEHIIPIEELYARLKTDPEQGLSTAEGARRLEEYGPNELTPPKQTPEWVKFLEQMFGGFATLLWVGSVLCFIAYGIEISRDGSDAAPDNLFLGSVLALVVIVTGIFSYMQESKSSSVMSKFAKMVPQKCKVIRDGKFNPDFPASKLVIGDIIEIKYGDKVPADIRIIHASGFQVDNSSLTGESEPQKRDIECSHEKPLETQNLAFFTTNAVKGTCRGVVILTGDHTVIGKIKRLVESTENTQTPIAQEIEHFIHVITTVAVLLGVTFFILSFVIGYTWLDAVIFLIGIIVANVPEGLLATVTVSLTLTALRMATKQVLVKNLESVETLGSTSCICSDKTGTLTQNKMTVAHVWYDEKIKKLGIIERESDYDVKNKSFEALWKIGSLCNTAQFVYDEDSTTDMPHQKRKTNGDASESAIMKFCDGIAATHRGEAQYLKESPEYRSSNPKKLNIPFNSSNKFAGSVHKTDDGREDGKLLFVLKGAPERVIDRCSHMLLEGKAVPMTDELKNSFTLGYEELGSMGERVLGFAHKFLDKSQFPEDFQFEDEEPYNGLIKMNDLVFVGLMALIDPPRLAVPSAVAECQSAGIQVIMVTGDHPITAKAIAKSVGIISLDTAEDLAQQRGLTKIGGKRFEELSIEQQKELHAEAKAQVVNGQQLGSMSEEDLDNVLKHEQVVFARTSPQQKLRIVQGCQRRGHVVAVTGDGVNDSPALKAADIGVAMGITGSDVSKEAADMILLDDNFASIVKGVEEGRLIFDNLKKSIAYTLTSNIPEISPFLIFIIFQVPLPLSTIMILAIDLGTDMYPAISLAYEKAESDIMQRMPRDPDHDNLVTGRLLQMTYMQIGMIQALAGFFCYFVVMGDMGFRPWILPGIRADWDDEDIEDLSDSYGQQWTYDDRKKLEQASQTSYFVSIVIVQWADIIICKTRILSIVDQKMHNRNLNQALVFETCLALLLTYVPGTEVVFNTMALRWQHFGFPAIPFSILIFCYDETRRYLIRKHRRENNGEAGWIERETYW